MQVEGDVRFTTMNVTNANVSIGGTMSIDRLHVGGEAHFESQGYVTGVYGGGTTPYHDSSNALYYDLSDGSANTGLNMRVTADEFRAVREGEQAEMRALATMKELKARLQQAGSAPDTFGQGMSNIYYYSIYLKIDNRIGVDRRHDATHAGALLRNDVAEDLTCELLTLIMAYDCNLYLLFIAKILMVMHFARQKGICSC